MSTPLAITEQTFEAEVLQAEMPVLADFWAAWCGPCRLIAPIVEDLASEYEHVLKVVKIDVDENVTVAERYNVQSIPTLGIFRDGRLVKRLVGYLPKAELRRQIDAVLRTAPAAAVMEGRG